MAGSTQEIDSTMKPKLFRRKVMITKPKRERKMESVVDAILPSIGNGSDNRFTMPEQQEPVRSEKKVSNDDWGWESEDEENSDGK